MGLGLAAGARRLGALGEAQAAPHLLAQAARGAVEGGTDVEVHTLGVDLGHSEESREEDAPQGFDDLCHHRRGGVLAHGRAGAERARGVQVHLASNSTAALTASSREGGLRPTPWPGTSRVAAAQAFCSPKSQVLR